MCAPDEPTAVAPKQLTVAELKGKLKSLGQPTTGKKPELTARLAEAAAAAATKEEAAADVPPSEAAVAVTEGSHRTDPCRPGHRSIVTLAVSRSPVWLTVPQPDNVAGFPSLYYLVD